MYDLNFICYHVYLDSLGLFWPSFELSLIKKKDEFVPTRPVGFAAGKNGSIWTLYSYISEVV